ncbi:hypothetical protein C8J57DRAFT_1362254, partial [Mycena rebaudengoi]
MGGFGNNQFEMTTASNANSFVAAQPAGSFLASSANRASTLLPTFTSDVIPLPRILDGAMYSISGCTYNPPTSHPTPPAYLAACSGVSNATLGKSLPPVMSARVSTRRSASIK